jgi:hypothetical protein
MKLKNLVLSTITGLVISLAANASAEVLQYLTFNITTFSQRPITYNGTNISAASPKVQSHNTAELLSTLAYDKAAQGNWQSNSFPSGAKLAVGENTFVVVLGTNVLVDVSDILSFSDGGNEIVSGRKSYQTGLSSPTTTRLQIGKLTFDDTEIQGGSGLKFYMQGVVSRIETDSIPIKGIYSHTVTSKLTSGTGEGTNTTGGSAFVLTGTITATGKGKEELAQ